ncbi:MAG: ABC transporter ATP-binding protein [Cellvibrionaceae bacterium]
MNAVGDSEYAITVRNLGYQYERSTEPALFDVSLQVRPGECFGLLGPNGAGKTTLLSILTGMLPIQVGEVAVAGHPLSQRLAVQRLSAIVPQDFAFYPALTGLENLNFFAGLYGLQGSAKQARVAQAAVTCRLDDVLNKPAETYSGGIKRRLNLAIGLLNNPKILYLDEPTVGIDAQSRKFILEAIKALKSEGMTIVYTSHYMEEVQAICDELAIIDHGKMVLRSNLAALLNEQELLLDVALREEPSPQQIANLAHLGRCEVTGMRLKLRLTSSDIGLETLLRELKSAGLATRQIQYGMNRLEDIYLSITNDELRE